MFKSLRFLTRQSDADSSGCWYAAEGWFCWNSWFFCWNSLFPTDFTCHCLNYAPELSLQLVHLQPFWTTVLSFVSWKLLFTLSIFNMIPGDALLVVPSMKLLSVQMGLSLIIAYCIKTAQGKITSIPRWSPKSLKKIRLDLSLVLSHGTGTS